MKRGQKGFTVVETLLVLILLAIIGFTGYYVYHTRNSADSSYNNIESTTSLQANHSSDWQTYTGKVSDQAQNPAVQADQIAYSFKYPSSWKFYPIGTESTVSGQTGSNSFQEIAPSLESDKAIAFNGVASTKSAKDYYIDAVGNQSGQVGPLWQGVKSFTTEKGYSGYTAKLDADTGVNYETYVSNNKSGLIDFHYGAAVDDATLQRIFNSVNIP